MEAMRQLAAILFADVQGYTGIMQKDEALARSVRNKFRESCQRIIPAYNGKIVQFSGDGNLSVFNSAVDAVTAGVSIQQEMLSGDVVVPLRIGIHSGDVIIEADNVFGDSVNLASRIESFAVPGSVLVSDKVYNEIRNKANLPAISVGKFVLKNVTSPVEIFALAVDGLVIPDKKKLSGKGTRYLRRKWLKLSSFVIVPIVLSILAIKYSNLTGAAKTEKVPDFVLQSRIAVLPFENKTSERSYDFLGTMTADYITQGLLNLSQVKVVMFKSVEENLEFAASRAFSERTGAQKLIKGNIYEDGDNLLVQSQLVDAVTGEIVLVLPEISGLKSDLTGLVKEVAARFAGYFALRDLIDLRTTTVIPTYDAYLKFREIYPIWGVDVPKTRQILQEAIALDSSFLHAYIFSFASYYNLRQWKEADSVMKLIDRKFPKVSVFEQQLLDVNRHMLAGNLPEAAAGWKKLYERDPKNIDINIWAALMAMANWRFQEALNIFRQIDPAHIVFDAKWKAIWIRNYAICLVRLKRFEEVPAILKHITARDPLFATEPLVYSFILQGKQDSVRLLVDRLESAGAVQSQQLDSFYVTIAEKYAIVHDTVNQKNWALRALSRLRADPAASGVVLGKAFFLAGDFEKSLKTAQEKLPVSYSGWELLSRIGCSYAKLGQQDKAKKLIGEIESIKSPYLRGENSYALAEVYACLDEKALAVTHLKKAFAQGRGMNSGFYWEDPDFVPLHGYQPFEDLIAPKD